MSQFPNPFFIQMRSDKNQSQRDLRLLVHGQEEKLGLIPNLLEDMKLGGRFGKADKALGPENRGGQGSQQAFQGRPVNRSAQGQEEGRGRVGQVLVVMVVVMIMFVIVPMIMGMVVTTFLAGLVIMVTTVAVVIVQGGMCMDAVGAEQAGIDLAVAAGEQLRGRIGRTQLGLDRLAPGRVDPVGLVEKNQVGIADLFLLHGTAPPRAGEIGAVDDQDHAADHGMALQRGGGEMVEHLVGVGQAGGLDPGQVEPGVVGQRADLLDQFVEALAADAAAGDAAQFQLPLGEQGGVDVDRAEIVDDDRHALKRNFRLREPVPECGGFAAAEKTGQQDKRERLGARRLRFHRIPFTVLQMHRLLALFFCGVIVPFWTLELARAVENKLGLDAKQMVVCIAPNDTSSEGTLQRFQRDTSGQWQPVGKPWPVLFGRGGLAWGRGLHPPQPGRQKATGDHSNPAGLFKIGLVLGYAPTLPAGSKAWPYHQVTDRDAWIDDAKTGLPYNHLYTLPPGAPFPPWWEKEKLHLGDSAYEWLVLIEHNYDNPVPGAGDLIFFHIRRGEHYRTAGCTTMKQEDLEAMIKWLDPASNPMLAELTKADYLRLWKEWQLPPPEKALAGKVN